jgi:copper transport protein
VRRRAIAVLALAVALTGLFAGDAQAHAGPRRTDPVEGATLGDTPEFVRVTFSEKPEPSLSSIRVLDTSGAAFHVGSAEPVADDPLSLAVRVRPLERGVYVVNWRVVSAVDGHPTQGAYAFGVRVSPAGIAVGGAAMNPAASRFEMLARWLLIAGLVVLAGAGMASVLQFGGPADRLLGGAGWLVAAAGLGLLAIAQQRSAAASFDQLLGTAIGRALIWRAAALGAAAVALMAAWTRPSIERAAMRAMAVAAAAAIAAHVGSGHAAARTGWELVTALVAQWSHMAAAAVWLGGLAALLAGIRGVPSAVKTAAIRRFSTIAGIALLVVAATGVIRAVGEMPSWSDLFSTGYGLTVAAKAGLLLVIAALGAANRWRSVPAAAANLAPLRRVGGVELLLAGGALAASAVLGTLAPPAAGLDAARELSVSGADFGTTVRVALTAASDQPGPNRFTLRATDFDTGEPVGAARVSLLFAPTDDPGVATTTLPLRPGPDDSFAGSGANLVFDGRWRVTVLIERAGTSTEIPLQLDVRSPSRLVSALRVPGRPPEYAVELQGIGHVFFSPEAERPGTTDVRVSFFSVVKEARAIDSLVVTATAEGALTHQVQVRRIAPHGFVASVELRPGQNTLDAIARATDGTRMRATVELDVATD